MMSSKFWYESGPVTQKQIHRLTASPTAGGEIGFNMGGGVARLLQSSYDTRGSTTTESHHQRRARVLYMAGYAAAMGSPDWMTYLSGDDRGYFPSQGLSAPLSAVELGRTDVLLVDRRPEMLALCAALGIQWNCDLTQQLKVMPVAAPRWVEFSFTERSFDGLPISKAIMDSQKQGMTIYDGLAAIAHGVHWSYQLYLAGSLNEDRIPILTRHTGGAVSLEYRQLDDDDCCSDSSRIGFIKVLK